MSITSSGTGFIDRKAELKFLLGRLKKGQNVAVLAPRRFGKSALIAQVLNQINTQKYLTCSIDLFASPTPELLSIKLFKEVLRNLKLHKAFRLFLKEESSLTQFPELLSLAEEFPGLAEFSLPEKDEWKLLSESLEFPDAFARQQGKQMICVLEEMDSIRHMDQGARSAALLKSNLESSSQTSYIFTACHLSNIKQITGSGKSAILKQENILILDFINKQVLKDSLSKKFSRLKLKLPRNYVESLVSLTKGHPYYTQQAVRQVILSYVLDGMIPKQKELGELLLRLEKDYLEKTWESIARNREYVQILLALPSGSANIYPRLMARGINVARAQKKLEEMGILLKNEQVGYSIADPLLELWIQKKLRP
jgi:AAA+ ATPase superfamily predicted ATPase